MENILSFYEKQRILPIFSCFTMSILFFCSDCKEISLFRMQKKDLFPGGFL